MRKNILKRLIDNLSGADLRKVRKDPMEIMGMEHPSEAAQAVCCQTKSGDDTIHRRAI